MRQACAFLADVFRQQKCCVAGHLPSLPTAGRVVKSHQKTLHVSQVWANGQNLQSQRKQLFIFLACCRHTNSAKASSSSLGKEVLTALLGASCMRRNTQDESCAFLSCILWQLNCFYRSHPIIEDLTSRGRLRGASHFDLSWQRTNVSASDVKIFQAPMSTLLHSS